MSLATEMVVVIAFFAFIGSRLDRYFVTEKPYFTAACSLSGVLLSLWYVLRDLNKM